MDFAFKKIKNVSIFLSFLWSKSDLNYPLLKAGAHFMVTPLCQAMVRSQIRVAGGKGGLNVFLGSPEEDPLGFSAALYCLNVKQSQLNFTNSFKGSLTLICTDYAVNTL